MRFYLKIILAISAYLLFSCKPVDVEKEEKGFSICLGEFKSFDEADLFKSKVDLSLWTQLRIRSEEKTKHYLLFGEFSTSFSAGQKAFELLNKSSILNYKIYKEGKYVRDDFSNLFFIAKYQGRPSIYNYDLLQKKSKLFWSRWGRKVLTLNHSKENVESFFTTALGYGKQGSFPYVRDVRVYKYDSSVNDVNELAELGTGFQIYTYWESFDTFKVNITKADSISSDFVIQNIYSFNLAGTEYEVKTRNFSITNAGFPIPPIVPPSFFSNNLSSQIISKVDGLITYIYLKDIKNHSEVMVASGSGIIEKIKWADSDNFVFVKLTPKNTTIKKINSELLIIDCSKNKTTRIFNNIKNLLVHGNFLFFDKDSPNGQNIIIYDFVNDFIYDEINLSGGSGINHL